MFKLNLRRKIFISYFALILILILISSQAIRSLSLLGERMNQVIQQNYQAIYAAQSLLTALEHHQGSEWKLIAGNFKEAGEEFNRSRDEFLKALEGAKNNTVPNGDKELIGKIETNYVQYEDLYDMLKKSMGQKKPSKIGFYSRAVRLQRDSLQEMAYTLLESNKKAILRISEQSRDLSTQYIQSLFIFSFIGVIGGMSIGLWLIHIIVRPIERLTMAIGEIRKGNFDISVDTQSPDEIGILTQEFNMMIKRVKKYQQLNLEKLIEEKKRTEAILRSVGDGMIVIDPNYKIIMVNPTAERLFYLIPGLSHGREIREVIKSEELYNIINAYIEKRADNYGTLPTFEWEYGRVKRHYQVRVFPVEKEDGSFIAYVVLLEDVTKLKELDQLKSDFISIASHELRTPMTSIIMSLELVAGEMAGPLNEDQMELLKAADEDARRMRHLMTNLLDISRIEAGRMEMDYLSVSPQKFIKDIINSFNIQAQNQKVVLIEEVEEELPNVRADYNRILQILTNLIGNALRHTPEEGSIILSATRENNFVRFGVIDSGPGIPRDYLKKIFRKFVQVDGDPKRGGAGLGLALSFEIIKAHKGRIWAESEIGKGASFYFTIPVDLSSAGENS